LDSLQHRRIRSQPQEKLKMQLQAQKAGLIKIHLLAIISTLMAVKMNITPNIAKTVWMMSLASMDAWSM
jgi:hypothetical protein